jgi:hypothetical protein
LFAPCASNDGAVWSDGPVASFRVQAVEVRAASVREPKTIHLVVGRDMGASHVGGLRKGTCPICGTG